MNLMFWAQSQTGRIIYNPENVSLEEIINEVFLLFEEIARQKKVSLQMNLKGNSEVYADKAMLSTIIRNLVSNAIKYTYPEGTVIISSEITEDCTQVSIKDSGVGMAEDVLKELFEIDSTRSTPGTNKEKGTGLGLIICKEFVEQHNGKLWVESLKDKGSTFKFSLPMKNAN
jgi:signal transduction histidine kinase